jgi:hypothetical protein
VKEEGGHGGAAPIGGVMAQKVKVSEGLEIEGEILKMEVRPGDVVAVLCEERVRPEFAVYLRKRLRAAFPENQVVVIDGGIKLQILREQTE